MAEKNERTIRVPFKGWGSPSVSVLIFDRDLSDRLFSGGSVIWHAECITDQMWSPGIYEIYKVCTGSPDAYKSREEAKEQKFTACRNLYLAVRRETPAPEKERWEQLLEDFRPHLSNRKYEQLLKELEGQTSEDKEILIREAMDDLMADMSYY